MQIPVRNIWLLQLYASSLYRSAGASLVEGEENPEELPQLVARILANEVTHRLHTGLTVGFQETSRSVNRVRGRINALPTERGQLLRKGQVSCTFDEVVADIPSNRLVRDALRKAARLVPDKPRYRALALQLEAARVTGPAPQLSMVPALQRQRLLARDRLMLAAAELLMTLSIPTTDEGIKMLPLPALDDTYLRKLFEHAAFGLYSHKLTPEGWSVSHGTRQKWQIEDASAGIGSILPGMQLDIVLEAPGVGDLAPRTGEPAPEIGELAARTEGPARRRLIIDTKFTAITKPNHYREQALNSGYVYQMYSYLMSQDQPEDEVKSEGLMLHPSIGEHIDEEVRIQGHRIRFATVDLMAEPGAFADSFLTAISPAW